MNKFTCSTCSEIHPLVTLLEFPQPAIISAISSGQSEADLNVLSKNIYRIDWKKLIIKVELNLRILDYEDDLDILIWSEVDLKHLKEKLPEFTSKKGGDIVLDAKLIQEIPFYRNTINSPITLTISHDGFDLYVKSVTTNEQLMADIEKGIELKDLTKILEQLYHYDETNFDENPD